MVLAEKEDMPDQQVSDSSKRYIALLMLLWFLTQFAGIFSPPLLDDVDSIHTEAAREMITRHDYVTLYVDGIRYLDKPPLPYWLAAGGAHLFGMHDWAFRLPLALSVLVLTLYLFRFGARLYGERAGLYAACAFATCLGPYLFTRFFIPDVMVALWMTASADLILRMVDSVRRDGVARPWQVVLLALVCTAGMLTKGLIGIVFPAGLLVLYLVLIGELRMLLRMRCLLFSSVFLVTMLPWHILAWRHNQASGGAKGWFWFYVVNDQINRYLNKRVPRDYDKVPLLTFWLLLVVWLLPWGVFLFGAARRWWQRRTAWRQGGPTAMLLVWSLMILLFFSFSTRQEYYTLPAVPALALLVGRFLADSDSEPQLRKARGYYISLFAVAAVAACVCIALAIVAHKPAPGADLFSALQEHPEDYRLSFGHLFDFTTTAFGFFRAPLITMAASLLVATGLPLFLKVRGRSFAANVVLAIGMCGVLASVHEGLRIFYPILGSEPLAEAIQRHWTLDARIVIDGEYSNGDSINFYTGQPVYMLNGRVNNLWFGSLYADAPHRFEDDASFLDLWQGRSTIFFVTHDLRRTQQWQTIHGGHLIGSSGGKYVLQNHS
jgi:4-amino-4-deoxy-L-arabinose transferase-like glycosyltransferase